MSTALLTHTHTQYDIGLDRDGFTVLLVGPNGIGRSPVEYGFDCEAEAQNRIDELLDAEAEERAEAAEAAASHAAYDAAENAKAALIKSVADFIWAADRGRFGSSLHCDDAESAYVTDLRNKLAAVEMTAATVEAFA